MKKKIFAASLALALGALALGGGSLAYFTSTATVTNTFTVGDVKIETLISKYHRAKQASGLLFTEGGVYEGSAETVAAVKNGHETAFTGEYISDAFLEADAENYSAYQATAGKNMVPGASVHFNPFIKNTGSNDAYVRMHVLIPVSLFEIIDNGPSYWTTTAMKEGEATSKAVDYYMEGKRYTLSNDFKVTRNDVEYYDFDFMYTDALKPGEITFWNPWGNIAISKNATQEQIAEASFDIIVEAEGVQADGFANAAAAFAATFDNK